MSKRAIESDMAKVKVKREKTEVRTLEDVVSDMHATVHAVVVWVSKVRNGGRFDAEVSDGCSLMRVVVFDERQQKVLEQLVGRPAVLKNCNTQWSAYSQKMEIIVKSYTVIEKSDMEFVIEDVNTIGSVFVSLAQISELNEFDRVTTKVKVTNVSETNVVGGGKKKKQEVTVGDKTGNARVTVWESDIGKLAVGFSYQLNRFVVRIFMGRKYLSWPPNGASTYAIDDIGDVDETLLDGETTETLVAAKVVGVYDMEKYYACIFCKKGNVNVNAGETVGKCDNCKAFQAISKDNEKITRKLFLECNGEKVSVRVNGEMLDKISEGKGSDASALLFASPFDVKYNEFRVVTGISRE